MCRVRIFREALLDTTRTHKTYGLSILEEKIINSFTVYKTE